MAPKYTAVKLKGAVGVAKNNDYKNAQIFKLKGDQYSKPKVGATFQPNNDFVRKFEKGEGRKANLTNAFGGGKGNRSNTGANFKGKSGKKEQKLKQPTIKVKDRNVSGVPQISTNRTVERIKKDDFDDKEVAKAFKEWSGFKATSDGKAAFNRDDLTMTKVYSDYITVKTAANNSEQYLKNNDPEAVLEEYTDASLAASRLPKEIRNTKSVGGGRFFGKGYVGTIESNFKTASKQAGYGAADKAYKTGWFGRPSVAAKIEESNLEAMKIQAEADVEEAKAQKEEGIERSVKSKNARINEIAADKKASASFLNKITGGLVGRDSLANLKVKAERTEAESAIKVAKQEGMAAEESTRAQRKAIAVQSGAFGARQRAQRLEGKELERLEERAAEGRPITKADKARLKFIREFSEGTPSSFARGESQVRSVVAPNAETIQAAKDWERKKRGSKK